MVAGPARCEFSAERFGPVFSRDVSEVPVLKVRHHRRNFSAGKSVMPMGGKGRYEVLILFENNGDTALQDVCINDILPSNFDIKDWSVKGAGKKNREDVSMETTSSGENGSAISWTIEEVVEEEPAAEESTEEESAAEEPTVEEPGETKACPICPVEVSSDASTCDTCGFTWD